MNMKRDVERGSLVPKEKLAGPKHASVVRIVAICALVVVVVGGLRIASFVLPFFAASTDLPSLTEELDDDSEEPFDYDDSDEKVHFEPPTGAAMLTYLDAALTPADVDAYVRFIEGWREQPITRKLAAHAPLGLSTDGPFGTLIAVVELFRWGRSMQDQNESLRVLKEYLQAQGGAALYVGRAVRIGALLIASERVASNEALGDPNSDRVADRLLELHAECEPMESDELASLYDPRDRTRDFIPIRPSYGQPTVRDRMAKLFGTCESMAFRRMPLATVETWRALSVDKRKELRALAYDRRLDGPHGMILSPDTLMRTAVEDPGLVLGKPIPEDASR